MFELFDPSSDFRITCGANLPHWYQPGVTYFVTFRTKDSIPLEVAHRWHAERSHWLEQHGISPSQSDWKNLFSSLPPGKRRQFHETFSRQYMENLDKGWGSCPLRDPRLSKLVADSLLHFDGERYRMGSFVVMPNHVHLIVGLKGSTDIVGQCFSWKKFTAGQINELTGLPGRFWQEETFDHLVRSPEQFDAVEQYIARNADHLPDGCFFLYRRME